MKTLVKFVSKLKIEVDSFIRYNLFVRAIFRYMLTLLAFCCTANRVKQRGYLLKSLQMVNEPGDETRLLKSLGRNLSESKISLNELDIFYKQDTCYIPKAVILKPYCSENEKGIIFVSFEKMLARIIKGRNVSQFLNEYHVVFSPSWSPPFSLALFALADNANSSLLSIISNSKDLKYLNALESNVKPINLYASSWVDPDRFFVTDFDEKDIDLLVVACFSKVKRHFALFKALSKIKDKGYKVCLIGHDEPGRDLDVIKAEAALYGVEDQIDFIGGVPYCDIPRYLSRAKASATFSKREGSCVIVIESMLANTPVGLYSDAEIGSKAFINEHTGLLFKEKSLAEDLCFLIENSKNYNPRQWVIDNEIHYIGSHKTLNEALKIMSDSKGDIWTKDIYKMKWCPNPKIVNCNDEFMKSEQNRIFELFGLRIGHFDHVEV